ncbi:MULTISPECIES: hypothetical protein [Sphingomonadales]|uniref:Uncharacterized protein n=1 Tax=Sphingobium scionense TaxID=1404341 RepID=A0A7W6PYN5_9SPHN|nr:MULTISPECIES: hypothetical protein [Sphingomonadaceae]AGH51483.1 hypothetical protein G432_18825 [Sphingomonas sp. MM-1]MBB4150165.1 hypothetical protein [Sphingobium scionense]
MTKNQPDKKPKRDPAQLFGGKRFDVEHALNMYATSFVLMPAFGIYEEKIVAAFKPHLAKCHIYVIGTMPAIETVDQRLEDGRLVIVILVAGKRHELAWPMPDGVELVETERGWFIKNGDGYWAPSDEEMARRLNDEQDAIGFEVLYIGQAYGKDGSRNALDRLLKHETLQRISVKGVPPDRRLTLLMLEIEPGNRMITFMNPWAENKEEGSARISAGLDKLFGTSDAERVTLYEASLIRYFQPPFNKEFKESFPSTNLKVLADCYDKDFSALISEICIDELPFKMTSDAVQPSQYHTAKFDLHEDEARQVFFGKKT